MQRTDESTPKSELLDGKLALGLAIGIMLAVVVFLTLETLGLNLTREELLTFVPALSTVVIASASAVLALVALREQRRMRQAGTDPVLIAHLGQNVDQPMLVTFNISNVGAGAAMNVHLSVFEPSDGFDKEHILTNIFEAHHPIRVILQNTSVSYNLGLGNVLVGEKKLNSFRAELAYEDIEGSKYWSSHEIDPRELEKRGASSPPLTNIDKHIKAISETLAKSASGFSPLNLLTQSKKERDAERTALYEEFKARKSRADEQSHL